MRKNAASAFLFIRLVIKYDVDVEVGFTCNYVCDKERQPADDEDSHHCPERLGGFCLFGESVINFAQKKSHHPPDIEKESPT